ncbi:MAG TPA: TonB-dependent receptor [Pyrinomonadaceae bacterium]|nr:TonB-dependent receptor [Pyrinomonadaceae bacterium]
MRSLRFQKKVSLLVLTLVLIGGPSYEAYAQAVYGSISGTITDPQGASVNTATVTVTNIAQNVTTTAKTNDSGFYEVTHLIPGTYQVKIEQQGYKTAIQEVVVKADVAATADVRLEVGALSETVTVTSVDLSLKTDKSDVATTFNQRQVQELPTFDRNFTRFVLLSPGTQQLPGWNHAASENPQGSLQTFVNGQHFSGTSFQLDGTDNRDPILGIIVVNPTLESVTETKITTQNYDAEFGQANAGVVTAQTRSGANDPHGSAFMFRRNDLTQARDPFTNNVPDVVTGKLLPDSVWSQFGGSFGWKLVKDKNFIFGDYQGTRSKEGGSVLTTVPTLLARGGNFSEYPVLIFDPASGDPVTGQGRVAFGGNIIPQGRLSPQALNLLADIPLPNLPGIVDNFSTSGQDVFDGDQFDIRDDQYVGQNLHIFGRYSFARFERTKPGAFGFDIGGPDLSGARFAGSSKVRNQSLALGFDYTLSSTVVTDFRLGYFRYRVNVLPGGVGTSPATDAGIPGLNVDDFFTSGMPAFGIETPGHRGDFDDRRVFKFGFSLFANGCNCPLSQLERQLQLVNNWTFLRGNHNYKFGGDLRFARNLRVPSDSHRAGQLFFRDAGTAFVNPDLTTSGGTGLASFLLGNVSDFGRFVSTVTDAEERQRRWYFYGQDTWRWSPKLTINYGLRWELVFPESIVEPGTGSLLNLETGELFVGGVGEVDKQFNVQTSYKAFAPRLGIAYQWTDKTVIRAGYGRSFDIGVFGSIFGHAVTQNPPVLAFQQLDQEDFRTVFNLSQGPPAPVFPAVPSNGRIPLPDGINARARPFRMRLPTLDAWNVTVQHQLSNNTSFEVGYVGNKGTHVFAGDGPAYNPNQPVAGPGPENLRKPFFTRFGWTQGINYFGNDADNRYNALQTKFEHRLPSLNILAHYTLSKTENNEDNYFIHNRELGRGPSSFDRTHVFFFTEVWDLPVGRGKKYLTGTSNAWDYAIGGWQVNSTTTWQSGLAFTPTVSGANCSVNSGPCRPDLIGNPDISDPDQNQWFQGGIGPGTPWAKAADGQFGNAKRGSLRGPAFFQTDLSIFKNFRITEKVKAEFRAEVFNLFNNVNLGLPTTEVDNPNAGRITGLQFPNARMRQWQFGARIKF